MLSWPVLQESEAADCAATVAGACVGFVATLMYALYVFSNCNVMLMGLRQCSWLYEKHAVTIQLSHREHCPDDCQIA